MWHKELWLIDHGASLYFHHAWQNWEEQALRPFTHVKDHVLLPRATELHAADAKFKSIVTVELIRSVVEQVPDEWLQTDSPFASPAAHREAYIRFLSLRAANAAIFVKEAQHAREILI